MAGKSRDEITEKGSAGWKDFEIVFRFLEHELGCRHLFSRDETGIRIQPYCAIIARTPISLRSGRKPTQRTHDMICYSFLGLADEDEIAGASGQFQRHAESKQH